MDNYLDKLPSFVSTVKEIREIIISNIVLIGQIASPTFHEEKRAGYLLERFAQFQVDECTTDSFGNPIGVIRGTSDSKPPIFVAAHIDTFFHKETYHNFVVTENTITGPGVLDNSAGVGVLASLPELISKLDIRFESDIVLAGVRQSIGKGNLGGIRHLLNSWKGPVRGAICMETGGLGRLNYYSDGMVRCEIDCHISIKNEWEYKFKPNAILILHEVISEILAMRLPQRPRARVIIGKISGGFKHGVIAYEAKLGFEIQSNSDEMVESVYNDIRDIADGISHEYAVDLKLTTISNQKASRLKYNHPLVKSAVTVMEKLDLEPISEHSESELSAFLSRGIPAITLGITHGDNIHQENAMIKIEPMYKGISQILAVLMAIDNGVCDE
ncbi:MAG: M20/M25/M40 family metallo-hydrolase [Desulfobacteraceae bacterium]|nr:M20/M25/M40 family metallo-hydrolase [Desulfobacteraceae bacterium]